MQSPKEISFLIYWIYFTTPLHLIARSSTHNVIKQINSMHIFSPFINCTCMYFLHFLYIFLLSIIFQKEINQGECTCTEYGVCVIMSQIRAFMNIFVLLHIRNYCLSQIVINIFLMMTTFYLLMERN